MFYKCNRSFSCGFNEWFCKSSSYKDLSMSLLLCSQWSQQFPERSHLHSLHYLHCVITRCPELTFIQKNRPHIHFHANRCNCLLCYFFFFFLWPCSFIYLDVHDWNKLCFLWALKINSLPDQQCMEKSCHPTWQKDKLHPWESCEGRLETAQLSRYIQ